MIDLRCGSWQTALADVDSVDLVLADPPYSAKTHDATDQIVGDSAMPDRANRSAIGYEPWSEVKANLFVSHWAQRCNGWMCIMTDDTLAPAIKQAYLDAGLYAFAPVPIIQKRPRLIGDGPSSWTVWLMVARPRNREMATWGCLPGAYFSHTEKNGGAVVGAKPISLMRSLVRDYSKPGNLIADPFAGSGSTLLAAASEGRRAIGSEMDPKTYAYAKKRIDGGYTEQMFPV